MSELKHIPEKQVDLDDNNYMEPNDTIKKKILLAEDEQFLARTYKNKLEVENFEVISASDGEEAVAMIRSEKPDLILLDLMMPIKSGFEVLQEIKGDESVKHIPIIVASNLGQQSDIDEAKRLGAVDFIVKSNVSLKDMAAKVKQYLPT